MKPSRKAIQVFFKSMHFPEGVLAWVDYDYDDENPVGYRRLKWVSENESVQLTLQNTLAGLGSYGFNHYDLHDGNPRLTAAMHAAKKYDITILTKATSSLGDIPDEYAPEDGDPNRGIRGIHDPIPTLDEIKQQLPPEDRHWVDSLSEPEIAELKKDLEKYTPEKVVDILLSQLDEEERYVEKIKKYRQNPALRRPSEMPWERPHHRPEERSAREQEIKAKTTRYKTYMSPELRQWFEELPLEEQYSEGALFYDEVVNTNIRVLEFKRARRERIEHMYFNGEKQIFP
jgi:hypothetical protein